MRPRSAHARSERLHEALRKKGMSQERAARIANSRDAWRHGGGASGGEATRPRGDDRAAQGRGARGWVRDSGPAPGAVSAAGPLTAASHD
jgi:hypothetical protein